MNHRVKSARIAILLANIVLFSALLGSILPASAAAADDKSFYGVVKDDSGHPVRGVFVQARNAKTNITTSVLTDRQGNYWFDPLPAGSYDLSTFGQGFTVDRRNGVKLDAGKSSPLDFTIKSRPVQWTELSWVDFRDLLPERPGKAEAMATCSACHGFRWHSIHPKDLAGWRSTLKWMQTEWSYFLGPEGVPEGGQPRLNDELIELLASYLSSVFGPEADLPQYPDIKRRDYYSDEALKIVFVDYEMPTRRAFPWSGRPDNKGNIWVPQYNANQIARLNPETGEIKEFKVPFPKRAAVHSAVPAPDGSVWATEASTAYRIARFDPTTEKFTEYPDTRDRGIRTKHTNAVDIHGNVWSSGGTFITRFDPKTEKYSYFGDKPLNWDSYGIATDQDGNAWFTRMGHNTFGKVDAATGKVKEWDRPKAGPRRIHVDSKGNVWFGEYSAGKAVRFDPKTETFKEYPLPGPEARPYGVGIDANDNFWYHAWGRSEMGRVDSNSGKVTQYPIPYIDPTMRDLFKDSKGRMWYGAPNANKVGYFYLRQ